MLNCVRQVAAIHGTKSTSRLFREFVCQAEKAEKITIGFGEMDVI